jgi:soluble lytic murein transglycosylase-like protein
VQARDAVDRLDSIYTGSGYVTQDEYYSKARRVNSRAERQAWKRSGRYTVRVSPARTVRMAVVERRHFALKQMVDSAAQTAGVPLHIAHAVIRHESGYKAHIRGRAGEYGLGQIKCQTARSVGFTGACAQLFDPATNLTYSMRYLNLALQRGGVAYYNAGIHARVLPQMARTYARRVQANFRY